MTAKRHDDGPSLFDALDDESDGPICAHTRERKTLTIWPGEDFERMTMTCERCGAVRGRYPNER